MHEVFGINYFDVKGVAGILLLFGIAEALTGAYRRSKRTRNDYITELVSFSQLTVLIQPAVILGTGLLLGHFFPTYENRFAGVSVWLQFVIFIFIDDLVQYWWHRAAHNFPWLWKLHIAHHASPDMGVATAYRNAALYYALMPNLFFSAIAIFVGFGKVYLVYTVIKLLIIMAAHSTLRWDSFLYRYTWLHPLAWLVEHTISTPATHFAHHGLSNNDGVSNNNGNFGNMLFFWDLLFGTDKITRQYPEQFGIENSANDAWYVMLYYPFVRSRNKGSDLK
jgi:sterol desaturase/sphingolipid hydroxylase (fatty acid hydroxylase superfamily)